MKITDIKKKIAEKIGPKKAYAQSSSGGRSKFYTLPSGKMYKVDKNDSRGTGRITGDSGVSESEAVEDYNRRPESSGTTATRFDSYAHSSHSPTDNRGVTGHYNSIKTKNPNWPNPKD